MFVGVAFAEPESTQIPEEDLVAEELEITENMIDFTHEFNDLSSKIEMNTEEQTILYIEVLEFKNMVDKHLQHIFTILIVFFIANFVVMGVYKK